MLVKNCIIVACLASVAMAQVNSIFCQARYITNVATCVIGVSECNSVESFSACVCTNTGNKPQLRQCLISLLRNPSFQGTLLASDFKALLSVDKPAEAVADKPAETVADKPAETVAEA